MNWLLENHGGKVVELVDKARANPVLAEQLDEVGDDVFGVWLIFVNRHLRPLGVTYRDLADWTWRDAFDDGMSPVMAARDALAADEIGQLMLAQL